MRIFLLSFSLLLAVEATAQVSNDDCINAISLGRIEQFCSAPGAYTNVGATVSGNGRANCFFDTLGRDVWFSFIATTTDVSIRVIGNLVRDGGGTLQEPEFALYDASCTMPTELGCASDQFRTNLAETFVDELLPGELYFLRVSAREGQVGTFQLCIEMFDFIPEPRGDCIDGVILCNKNPFTVSNIIGSGNDPNEIERGSCLYNEQFPTDTESGSVWYRWTCDQPGTLGFVLTPNNPTDDLDFAVYELPGGIDDCANKRVIRCMASGANTNAPTNTWERCSGQTGLRDGDPDNREDPGCDLGDNNFANSFQMVAGGTYVMVVNNFSATGNGFGIVFTGTGTFLGPRPEFAINPETGNQCDEDLIDFTNLSTLTPGSTGTYEWFFGGFANPAQATGVGPHQVSYASFGEKSITLRVTSSEGCVVTDTREIFIQPCCEGSEPVVADEPIGIDPFCPGTATGEFSVSVSSGVPDFFYSIDGGPYLPDTEFEGLFAGTYDVFVRNIKGCLDTVDVTLVDPPPITVEIGNDYTVDLGTRISIPAQVSFGSGYTYTWSSPDSISCLNPECSEIEVFATQPSELTVTIVNEQGCTASDLLQIDVRKIRPLYAPNAFSPNIDGLNDRWTIFGPEGVLIRINSLRIFDRWGNMVFEAFDLPVNDQSQGWDGLFNGRELKPAVFAFYAEIEYADGEVLPVTGDINLIR